MLPMLQMWACVDPPLRHMMQHVETGETRWLDRFGSSDHDIDRFRTRDRSDEVTTRSVDRMVWSRAGGPADGGHV